RAGKAGGAARQDEGVIVPLEDREGRVDAPEDRIGLALVIQLDGLPAEFGRAADDVFGGVGSGEQLAAETDAQYRAASVGELADQLEQVREVGMGVVCQRILASAEHDQRIVRRGILRQRVAEIGENRLYLRFGFIQCCSEKTKTSALEILDDK